MIIFTRGRKFAVCAAMALTIGGTSIPAQAEFPERPLRFIVPTAPGGSPDIVARVLANKLVEQLRQQVIVDVRPGGSGIIGVEIAKAAAPDGYTLLLATFTTFASLPALKTKLSYDTERDFSALTRAASVANVVAVHPSLGVNTAAELASLAKARPGQLNYGSAGNGSPAHIAGEMFDLFAGVKTVHVPYKGAAPALNDLISGQLQFIMTSPLVALPHGKSGRIKVIATTGAKRDPLLPELPPVADAVPGFEITQWWGVAVPARTPAAVAGKLHAEIVKALQSPAVQELLAKQGATAHAESPASFAAFIKAERGRVARVGRQAGITLD